MVNFIMTAIGYHVLRHEIVDPLAIAYARRTNLEAQKAAQKAELARRETEMLLGIKVQEAIAKTPDEKKNVAEIQAIITRAVTREAEHFEEEQQRVQDQITALHRRVTRAGVRVTAQFLHNKYQSDSIQNQLALFLPLFIAATKIISSPEPLFLEMNLSLVSDTLINKAIRVDSVSALVLREGVKFLSGIATCAAIKVGAAALSGAALPATATLATGAAGSYLLGRSIRCVLGMIIGKLAQ